MSFKNYYLLNSYASKELNFDKQSTCTYEFDTSSDSKNLQPLLFVILHLIFTGRLACSWSMVLSVPTG